MSAMDVAREVFPRLSDDDLFALLWEHTGFPEFWNIPEDGATPIECCRKQLTDLRDEGPGCPRCGVRQGGPWNGSGLCMWCAVICRDIPSSAPRPGAGEP